MNYNKFSKNIQYAFKDFKRGLRGDSEIGKDIAEKIISFLYGLYKLSLLLIPAAVVYAVVRYSQRKKVEVDRKEIKKMGIKKFCAQQKILPWWARSVFYWKKRGGYCE